MLRRPHQPQEWKENQLLSCVSHCHTGSLRQQSHFYANGHGSLVGHHWGGILLPKDMNLTSNQPSDSTLRPAVSIMNVSGCPGPRPPPPVLLTPPSFPTPWCGPAARTAKFLLTSWFRGNSRDWTSFVEDGRCGEEDRGRGQRPEGNPTQRTTQC